MSPYKRARGRQPRETLIEAHLPLVHAVARRYTGHGVELDDLVQAGSLGLVKASDRFDASRGVTFAAFAAPVIEGEIRHHVRDRSTTVRLPRRLQRLAAEAGRRRDELTTSLGRRPTTAELAEAIDADPADLQLALDAHAAARPVPLPDEDAGGSTTGPADAAEDRLLVEARLRELAPRERQIVYLRFHRDLTERQIARELGISQAHVSRLLAAALEQLRTTEPAGAGQASVTPSSEPVTAPSPAGEPAPADATATTDEPARTDQREQRDAPAPADPAPSHSGRFLVRMPSELHRALAEAAEQRHVSLNRFVTHTLADAVLPGSSDLAATPAPHPDGDQADPGGPAPEAPAAPGQRPRSHAFRLVFAANVIVIAVAATLAVALIVLALQRGL